jgi:hypothetical protein
MQILLNHQRRLLYSRAGAKGTLEAIGASRAGNRDGVRPATVLYGCCRKPTSNASNCDIDHRMKRNAVPSCCRKQEGNSMYVVDGVLVIAMLFIFFLPITDYKTVRMKLCVLCALALVLTVSVTRTHVPDPRLASLTR